MQEGKGAPSSSTPGAAPALVDGPPVPAGSAAPTVELRQAVSSIERALGQLESQLERESAESARLGSELQASRVSGAAGGQGGAGRGGAGRAGRGGAGRGGAGRGGAGRGGAG